MANCILETLALTAMCAGFEPEIEVPTYECASYGPWYCERNTLVISDVLKLPTIVDVPPTTVITVEPPEWVYPPYQRKLNGPESSAFTTWMGGRDDGAVASADVAPVPLLPSFVLFISGLIPFGLFRRFK